MQKLIEEFLLNNKGYLKKSAFVIAYRLQIESSEQNIQLIKDLVKDIKNRPEPVNINYLQTDLPQQTLTYSFISPEYNETVLVIGDIHEPFTLDGYLEFCVEQYEKFNCTKVVFIGDIVDNAFSSFHPTNPDGFGAGDELDRAISKIAKWYEAFPEATIIVGNHDRLAYRKAFSGGISARWLRDYNDVLETPNWKFQESIVIDEVLYIHGEAGTARNKAKDMSQSVVQGHLHSQGYTEFINNRVFAMQVGSGIDDNQYAFNYNKAGKESILSCGVVIEGKQPFLIKM